MNLSFLSSAEHSAARARLLRANVASPVRGPASSEVPGAEPGRAADATPFGGIGPIEDTVTLSPEALAALAAGGESVASASVDGASDGARPGAEAAGVLELSDAEQREVQELKARDAEVRAHEAAHAAAAGDLALGGASFEFERGPDGASYAVAGEVQISVGSGNTAKERLANAERAQRAANAPASPSGADRAVAAKAAQAASEARTELREEQADGDEAASAVEPRLAAQRAEAYTSSVIAAEAAPRLLATFG